MHRLMEAFSGARKGEYRQVILAFFALVFLMLSYYIIKPLRDSQFLKEFDANYLPFIYLAVPFLSLTVTKIFNYLADRHEKYRLIASVFVVIMLTKVAFTWLLTAAGKPAVVVFYFFASVYFLLAMSTLWACINDIFTVEQGERCFGFVAMGSTVGSIVGSKFSGWLSATPMRGYATIFSAVSMGLALLLILIAAQERRAIRAQRKADREAAEAASGEPKVAEESKEFWSDVRELWRRPYVRRIGLMVMILAIFTTSLDFVSKRVLDEELTKKQYHASFPELADEDMRTVHKLKIASEEDREVVLAELAKKRGKSVEQMKTDYEEFRKDLEAETRKVFSRIYLYQGFLGIFLLLVVARIVFANLGLRYAVLILPVTAIIGLVALAMPIELFMVEIVMVVTGAANYSLNNAAKEVLYTATDEETKFKHKPLIEGPGMRVGDVSASLLKIALLGVAARFALGEQLIDQIFLGIAVLLVLVWGQQIYLAGKEYDFERKQQAAEKWD